MTYIEKEEYQLCVQVIALAKECQRMLGDRTVYFTSEPTKLEILEEARRKGKK